MRGRGEAWRRLPVQALRFVDPAKERGRFVVDDALVDLGSLLAPRPMHPLSASDAGAFEDLEAVPEFEPLREGAEIYTAGGSYDGPAIAETSAAWSSA